MSRPPLPQPFAPGAAAVEAAASDHASLRGAAVALSRLQAAVEGRDGTLPHPALAEALAVLRSLVDETEAVRARYDSLFNAVPDPVAVLDAEGRLLDLNQAALKSYGLPREALIGQRIAAINPRLPDDHMREVWKRLDQGRTHVVETLNRRGDGSEFPVEVHSAAFDDGGRRCIVAVARDLSRREQAEKQYRRLLESIDKGVVVQDGGGRPLSGNQAAFRILGLSPGALSQRLVLRDWRLLDEHGQRVPLRDLPGLRALREGRIVESTVLGLYHRRERRLRWVSVTAVPQFEPGQPHASQVISLFSDVTGLKRGTSLFRRAQAQARIGGFEWERDRDHWHLTDQALKLLGDPHPPPVSLEEVVALLDPDDSHAVRSALLRLAENGRPLRIEFRLKGDGARVETWLRLTGEAEGPGPLATRIIGTVQDVTEGKRAEADLRLRALTDPLTGLLNREGIQAEIEARMSRGAPSGVAVLYVDLDRFKTVNDLLGHNAGDEVLVRVAARLRHSVGDESVLARFGGDEFLVLVDSPDDPDRPDHLAHRITHDFADSFRYGEEEFSITTSVGLARHPRDGDNAQQLINHADAAMYAAKRRGRNRWQSYTPSLSERQRQRLQVEAHLHRAIENRELRLVYQPQVDLASGRVLAAEALLRWHSQALGEMPPERFIEHAETTGDIVRIGEWVLGEACRQLQAWRAAGTGLARVCVNVSFRQFLSENLATQVKAALDEHGLLGACLELEFTERVLIEDASDTLYTFQALRAMGVKLTIDDFGEGYSALDYLRRLPIDGIKLSKTFLQGVPDEPSDVAICRAITGIARSLGLNTVAEGVETEAQRRFLLQNGIRVGQGFLFGAGLTPERLEARIRSQESPS